MVEKSKYFLIKLKIMRSSAKFSKVINALASAIQAKNNSTDLLFHLQKEFPDHKDIKKLFSNAFDKEFLKGVNVLKEEKSEVDKRKVEYRLDELHKLYKKYVGLCKKYADINCQRIVGNLILHTFITYSAQIEYNILEKIENELKNTLLPQKEKDRGLIGFTSPAFLTKSLEEIHFERQIKDIKDLINVEKIILEIDLVLSVIKSI
jgi:protein subunit release factor A